MVAGAFSLCGAWTGKTVPGGGPENPRGFFEHIIIRERVVKQMLMQLGCDPLGVQKLPPIDLKGGVDGLSDLLRRIVESEGYANDRPWLYKDAKLTLVWPYFRHAFPDAKWILVRRDDEGFINSCLKTGFMNQHSDRPGFWKQFAQEYRRRIDALKATGADMLEVFSPDLIKGDYDGLETVLKEVGLEFNRQALDEFISPDYWHGKGGTNAPTR